MELLKNNKGFSLVEILVAIGVIGIVVVAAVASLAVSQETVQVGRGKTKGVQYLTEYVEAVKNLKREDWDTLANGRYIVSVSSGNLSLVTTTTGEEVNGYTRYLDIADAYRDVSGNLVETPGTEDPSTKRITITVSWAGVKPGTLEESFYVTRYLDNLSWIQTTEAEFDGGTHSGTATVNTNGGEVQLGAGGAGDWCEPNSFIVAELNLPESGEAKAVEAYEGKAFTGTDPSSGGDFIEIDISNDNPPVPSIASTISGYSTNDVYIDGNYAYVATDDYSKDVVIIDLTTNSEVGYFNGYNGWLFKLPAEGVHVEGDVGYVTIGTRFYTFDLTSKTGSRPSHDYVFLWGVGYRLDVHGDYAYIAMEYLFSELRLVNVSNPNNLDMGARADINGEKGQEVHVNETGTRAYLATDESGSHDEFFIIDSDVSASQKDDFWHYLSVVGSYDAQGMDPRGVVVVPGNRAILVGTEQQEYHALDITNESNPVYCGGVDVDAGIIGVDAVLETDGDAFSYIITKDPANEFKVIEGGPGGLYASSGTFESSTFDAGSETGFNRFDVNSTKPINTDITYQIAVVDPGVSNCADAVFNDFTFVGPDGTSASFFTDGDSIPLDNDDSGFENPGQCMRYRAYLTTGDSFTTPIFEDITINYSP